MTHIRPHGLSVVEVGTFNAQIATCRFGLTIQWIGDSDRRSAGESGADVTAGIDLDRVQGCLLGGAIGDALGANIEFSSASEIRRKFGELGVREFVAGPYPVGSITDDTQMTLFTAEGIIRATARYRSKGICNPTEVLRRAYLRWLSTQETVELDIDQAAFTTGFLVHEPLLHATRAPGNTCLSALRAGGQRFEDPPMNDSKGCGAVMRSAPFGIIEDPRRCYSEAHHAAALTHGHPTGQASAAALAVMVNQLLRGQSLEAAAMAALELLGDGQRTTETRVAIQRALDLASSDDVARRDVQPLGGGWTGEEALAIALFAALVGESPLDSLSLAVSHGGDSDSTGAICGNLLGAAVGSRNLPQELAAQVEGRELTLMVGADLYASLIEGATIDWDRYPGY